MQPIQKLKKGLTGLVSAERYLFAPSDLHALVPEISDGAFRTLLSRAVREGYLERPCRGIYLVNAATSHDGLMLYRIAARLRANELSYISLETALSDAGLISQIPMGRITVMCSGRSNTISCGRFGEIEFVHTSRKPADLMGQLSYDSRCHMWRASNELALRDMTLTHRNKDLILEGIDHESV
jgi:predicted transcriptional regulator of viral defense system